MDNKNCLECGIELEENMQDPEKELCDACFKEAIGQDDPYYENIK